MAGCDRCKSTAESHLADQNITQVQLQQLTQQGCLYRFTGTRDGRFCSGELNIRFAGSMAQVNQRDRCNPEAKETVTGPDVPPPPSRKDSEERGVTKRPMSL